MARTAATIPALYAEVSTQEVLRCVVQGARWLGEPSTAELPTKSAISQARIRLGAAPLEALYRAVVAPVATEGTPGAWYRGWRLGGGGLGLPPHATGAIGIPAIVARRDVALVGRVDPHPGQELQRVSGLGARRRTLGRVGPVGHGLRTAVVGEAFQRDRQGARRRGPGMCGAAGPLYRRLGEAPRARAGALHQLQYHHHRERIGTSVAARAGVGTSGAGAW
jgi:hypothetical protein